MRIRHGRVGLELHRLADGGDPALLLLHELYGSGRDWDVQATGWPGRVYALDFSGHGRSDRLRGGAYLPEMLVGDADAALARIGGAAVAGRGVGAYVALLLAAARRDDVPAALLLPGRGLSGGAARPSFEAEVFGRYLSPPGEAPLGVDQRVHVLDIDVRPADYAERFARAARRLLLYEDGGARPPWWVAAGACAGVVETSAGDEEVFRRLHAAAVEA
jgi:pimeloyl-ACP methyl ester carboxylesterase